MSYSISDAASDRGMLRKPTATGSDLAIEGADLGASILCCCGNWRAPPNLTCNS